MLNPFTGQEQEILLAVIEPVTMAIIGSLDLQGAISNWIGGNKQANTSQEIERERIAAAEREAREAAGLRARADRAVPGELLRGRSSRTSRCVSR